MNCIGILQGSYSLSCIVGWNIGGSKLSKDLVGYHMVNSNYDEHNYPLCRCLLLMEKLRYILQVCKPKDFEKLKVFKPTKERSCYENFVFN